VLTPPEFYARATAMTAIGRHAALVMQLPNEVDEVRDGKFARAQMFHYDMHAINAFLERAREASTSAAA
jgi:hypothetical protein